MKITDLTLWRTFLAVAHAESFTRAAKVLHTNAPTVTKRISVLEGQLGVRLFNRTTRVVQLTVDGESLVPQVTQLLDQALEVEDRALDARKVSGLIRVTCLNGLAQRWLAPLVVQFQRRHPQVRFDLIPTDQIVDLIQEQVDLALRIQDPRGSDFVFRELWKNELVVCASPSYLRRAPPIRKPADLSHHPLLTLAVHADLRFPRTGERLGDLNTRPQMTCTSGPFLTELALLGAGVAVRARYDVREHLATGRLRAVLTEHPLEYFRNVYLVIPQRRYVSARVRLFADWLVAHKDWLSLTRGTKTS